MELETNKILDNFGLYWDDIAIRTTNNRTISYGELIYLILIKDDVRLVSSVSKISSRTLNRYLPKLFPNLGLAGPWKSRLLYSVSLKICPRCSVIKSLGEYASVYSTASGVAGICKYCDNTKSKRYYLNNIDKCNSYGKLHYLSNKSMYIANNARRRANKLKATPAWSETKLINNLYNNTPKGFHVDHWIPLNNKIVCGLHVLANLRHLNAKDNLIKGNTFNPEEFES